MSASGRRGRRALALAVALAALGASPAAAQQASYGQYLLVLDDSGSMNQSDPRRLVEMAALAFVGALEDGDQVMLAGLNELAEGAPAMGFVSPREILAGRDGEEAIRPIGSESLDRHEGQTPCRAALERARTELNAMASGGAPQTLLLLTDGACNGGPVEDAERWLAGLRARDRFRFVPLMREGRGGVDPALHALAERTGWRGPERVGFDARSLLRAFADVLSFSRGLRFDDGGRVGLERTFAGARTVRVLAIRDRGEGTIGLERADRDGVRPVPGGPTFRHRAHGWSVRATAETPAETPYAVRSPDAGADALVIPVYGRLRVEGVVAPCGEAPPLPWSLERTVRAGQPACAWARLVGDRGDTIHPDRSFAFQMEVCEAPGCEDASPMQVGPDGSFHAQLGAEVPLGRHERTFRASGDGMAAPIEARRGFSAVSFGIHRVATAAAPAVPIQEVALGTLPKPTSDDVQLVVHGAFPRDSHASVSCQAEGAPELAECVVCEPSAPTVELTDPFTVQVRVRATAFCPSVSADGRDAPIELRLVIRPEGSVPERSIPLRATLRYARAEAVHLGVVGGSRARGVVQVPAPVAAEEVVATVELDVDGLTAAPLEAEARQRAGEDGRAERELTAEAEGCCGVDTYRGALRLRARSGGPELTVPLEVRVTDPGFWVCPGQQIALWTGLALALLLLVWIVRGFLRPSRFRDGAVLCWAESHEALLRLREGDEGFRKLARFVETKRGFRRDAALHLGGPRAPLPSLKRLPDDGHVRATEGGGATLVVTGPGIERFEESSGWVELAQGEYPVSNRITLRRVGEDVYLQLRR